jgi:hypothetical protein
MANDSQISKIPCIECGRKTNHDIVYELEQESEDIFGFPIITRFQTLQCRGCETVTFCENRTEELGSVKDMQFYPGRASGKGPMIGTFRFPTTTRKMYNEVLQALNNDAPVLAAIGLRSLIESICIAQKTSAKNLMGCIDELADMGLLSKRQADFLHTHRFLGNVAAHEMKEPKPEELSAALDIAETLLKTIYILPHVAASITTGKQKPSTSSS